MTEDGVRTIAARLTKTFVRGVVAGGVLFAAVIGYALQTGNTTPVRVVGFSFLALAFAAAWLIDRRVRKFRSQQPVPQGGEPFQRPDAPSPSISGTEENSKPP